MEHVGTPPSFGPSGNDGTVTAVQDAASDSNPEPVNVNTVLIVPDVGVIITSGVTLKGSAGVRSFIGVPFTCTSHGFLSLVAYGLTTKDPSAIPGETTEQVEEVISVLLGDDCILQPVSDGFSPVPTTVTVDSSTALPGDNVVVGAP
jgi:hypothetical protein